MQPSRSIPFNTAGVCSIRTEFSASTKAFLACSLRTETSRRGSLSGVGGGGWSSTVVEVEGAAIAYAPSVFAREFCLDASCLRTIAVTLRN